MQIVLSNVSKNYHKQIVFKNIHYVFEPSTNYAITGHNGSGKSTLILTLFDYNTISKGEIKFYLGGELIEENPQLHMSFASPYIELPEELTLTELISFHFSLRKKRTTLDIDELLEQTKLKDHQNKIIKYYSSGMKQRVKLILAFATQADVLLLDEPCSNFDEAGIIWYKKCIESVIGTCTIVVASNQKYEYEFCENIIEIEQFK